MVLGVFLSGCTTLFGKEVNPIPLASEKFSFKQYEIVTGTAKHQTVLTGSLLGGITAEIVVVSIDTSHNRRLFLYEFNSESWAIKLDATLRPEVLFVDVVNIKGRDRLITYEHGRINWFEPETSIEHLLVEVSSNVPPHEIDVPHVDITRDLNGDDRDDIVLPDTDGFWVFIQMNDGAFADPVKIGPSFKMGEIYTADGYRFSPWNESRVHEVDYNRDGRIDLVFWREDHFVVHHQDEHGLFSPDTETFCTEVRFDSDDLSLLVAPEGVRGRRFDHGAPGVMTGRVLHELTDMNHDGVADLAVFCLQAGSGRLFGQTSKLWGMRSTYEVHFGVPAPGATDFELEVDTVIRADGIPFEIATRDFDHDGHVDVMFTIINPGIFKIIGMLVRGMATDSALLDLNLYRLTDNSYPDAPNTSRKIKAYTPGDSGEKAMHFPALLYGDVSGDGLSDLLVQNGLKELYVFIGERGPNMFARKPQKVAINMPYEEYTQLIDLNGDGLYDVLMHHPSIAEPHRVTMLIAQ